jgi:hypothetical protein
MIHIVEVLVHEDMDLLWLVVECYFKWEKVRGVCVWLSLTWCWNESDVKLEVKARGRARGGVHFGLWIEDYERLVTHVRMEERYYECNYVRDGVSEMMRGIKYGIALGLLWCFVHASFSLKEKEREMERVWDEMVVCLTWQFVHLFEEEEEFSECIGDGIHIGLSYYYYYFPFLSCLNFWMEWVN